MGERLAIDGGQPVRSGPLPGVGDISGRTVGEEELANLREVIESGKMFRFGGHFVQDLENGLAEILGVPHVVAVTSGTAAVHTALASLDLNPGDEVIVPPITDMGSVAPILALNLIPVFADVDEGTLCLDPASVEKSITSRTRAIVAVHLAGNVCDMDALASLAKGRDIYLIEDCAQAYMAEDNGRLAGTIGDIAAFSLQQSKHISTGDGGAVVTADEKLGLRAAMFMDKGWDRVGGGREYLMLGLNYRMNELTGAVACAQIRKLKGVVDSRRRSAERLSGRLAGTPNLTLPPARPGVKPSWWFYGMFWNADGTGITAQKFAEAVTAEGVPVGAGYIGHPIFDTPAMREHKTYGESHYPYGQAGRDVHYRNEDVPQACSAMSRLIVVPINEKFTEQHVDDIGQAITKVATAYSA